MPYRNYEHVAVALAWPAITFLLTLLVLLVIRRVALARLSRRAPVSPLAAATVQVLGGPSVLWCLATAFAYALRSARLTERQYDTAVEYITAFVVLSLSWAIAGLLTRSVTLYGERRSLPFAVAGLSRTLINVLVFGIGTLAVLRVFNKDITPLLTALGVGGLAVALALQDTLANFFAGVHILLENPIRVGEFVRLSSGEEGTVSDIGWRTTRFQTGANNTIVIPNTKITTGILTNYSLPDRRVIVEVPILAGIDADPYQIRQISLEVAASTEGVLADPPPGFSFDPGVIMGAQQGKLSFCVAGRAQQGPVQSNVRLRLLQRFRAERVPLPTTDHTVVVRQ